MLIGRIEGATRVLGRDQGYHGLPVRDVVIDCHPDGRVPAMETVWLPTPAELERLAAGASIKLIVLGTQHPPVMMEVGPAPDALECPIG